MVEWSWNSSCIRATAEKYYISRPLFETVVMYDSINGIWKNIKVGEMTMATAMDQKEKARATVRAYRNSEVENMAKDLFSRFLSAGSTVDCEKLARNCLTAAENFYTTLQVQRNLERETTIVQVSPITTLEPDVVLAKFTYFKTSGKWYTSAEGRLPKEWNLCDDLRKTIEQLNTGWPGITGDATNFITHVSTANDGEFLLMDVQEESVAQEKFIKPSR